MRPPMKQNIYVSVPKLDDNGNPVTDRFGKPIMGEAKKYPARIRRGDSFIRNRDGTLTHTNLTIHCDSDVPIESKQHVGFEDVNGVRGECLIESVSDSVNLSANKVYFKVVRAYE